MCIGSGGSDSGVADRAEARALTEQTRVKDSVAKLNAMFGIAPDAATAGSAPTSDQFTHSVATGGGNGGGGENENGSDPVAYNPGSMFDQSGYDGALKAFQSMADLTPQAAANKTARENIYSGIEGATKDLGMHTLDNEFNDAGREVNFDAARRGLYGGSAYADSLGNLTEKRNDGVLKITDAATSAANSARSADDSTRLGLARDITNGLDESTAIASAQSQLATNAAEAKSNATQNSLNGFFGTVLTNLRNNAVQAGITNAQNTYGTAPAQRVSNGLYFSR